MTSSKKKRGKQRKAAKLAAAANNNISGDDTTPAVGGDVGSEISGGHRTNDLHLLDDRTDFIDCMFIYQKCRSCIAHSDIGLFIQYLFNFSST